MPSPLQKKLPSNEPGSNDVTDVSSSGIPLTLKQKAGDASNRWLERNRNLVLRQTPFWIQSIAGIMIALGAITVTGSFLFKIDEVVTVQGQLVTIGGTVPVKTPAGGRVAEVLFEDGEYVQKGQLLVKLDTRQAADEKETLTRLITVEEQQLASRLSTLESQAQTLEGRYEVLEQRLKTKDTITSEMKKLVAAGGFQRIQLLEQLDQVYELRKQLTEVKQQQSQLLLEANQNRLETAKNIDRMQSQLKQAELQLQYQNVLAPVEGVVFDPKANPKGVLEAGQRILSIVPQVGLYAEVFVPNQDIGFVKTGQEAKVRVDAFPFTRYGDLLGKVTQIGADALPPDSTNGFYRFPVKLQLDNSYLESKGVKIPLKSGMAITTNLKLREKRVISLVSDLLVDQTDSINSIRQQ